MGAVDIKAPPGMVPGDPPQAAARLERMVTRMMEKGPPRIQDRVADPALRVLAAEDDQVFGSLLRMAIRAPTRVEVAETGLRAGQLYLASAPDLLLLDLHLGDMDGLQLLEQVMRYDDDAYVIILSGNSYGARVSAALNAGARGFIAKPFNLSILYHHLGRAAQYRNKVPDQAWR